MTQATAARERPILFSSPMVQAILDGRKSVTRRIIKPQFGMAWGWGVPSQKGFECSRPGQKWRDAFGVDTDIKAPDGRWTYVFCPYGKPGDRLYVKETWARGATDFSGDGVVLGAAPDEPGGWPVYYRADGERDRATLFRGRWNSGRFMPRWAARIILQIEDVRIERLQQITEEDAMAEGVSRDFFAITSGPAYTETHREAFARLWGKINGKGSWERDGWVWVVSFKRTEP